jgi:hypothetical protein
MVRRYKEIADCFAAQTSCWSSARGASQAVLRLWGGVGGLGCALGSNEGSD